MDRMNWDEYFMNITEIVALRSGCIRRKVGAIIVKDKRVLSSGYNSAPLGVTECCNRGYCLREKAEQGEDLHNCISVHAEANAITQCAKYGISCENAILYVNTFPCINCMKLIINSGIKEIIYLEDYKNTELSKQLAKESGIKIRKYNSN